MLSVRLRFTASVEEEESRVNVVDVGFAVSMVKAEEMEEEVLFAASPSFTVTRTCIVVEYICPSWLFANQKAFVEVEDTSLVTAE